ncbi:MAG: tetratricopeptide repeat protein, partial [Pseudomonadota bacterium]
DFANPSADNNGIDSDFEDDLNDGAEGGFDASFDDAAFDDDAFNAASFDDHEEDGPSAAADADAAYDENAPDADFGEVPGAQAPEDVNTSAAQTDDDIDAYEQSFDGAAARTADETDELLSQVREAFNDDFDGEQADDPAPKGSNDEGLSAVLAELEGMHAGAREDTTTQSAPAADGADALAADNAERALNSEPENTQTAEDETDAAPAKRRLTPKQRAVLAARIRRKRLAAQEAATASVAEEAKADDLDDPETDTNIDADASDETPRSLFKRLASALPIIGKKSGDAAEEETSVDDGEEELTDAKIAAKPEEKPVVSKLSKNAEFIDDDDVEDDPDYTNDLTDFDDLDDEERRGGVGRSAALAMGVAVMALLGGGYYMLTRPAAPPAPVASQEGQAMADASAAFEPEPETTGEPAIQPRDLYIDAVQALQAATTPEAETAAIETLKQSAALGHPPAQLQLGELYKTGQGVPADVDEARLWYERAANGGNILAMHRVGIMNAKGEGSEPNVPAAIEWFEKAANHALIDAQYNLGAIYHPSTEDDGAGVQNAAQAYYWYSLAGKNGDAQASELAEAMAGLIDADMRAELDRSISDWTPAPANPVANEIIPAS